MYASGMRLRLGRKSRVFESLHSDVANNNAYMNSYMKDRWTKRRLIALETLGGKCVVCGTTENLEFDHIDRSTKLMSIASASSMSESFFWSEVTKCQLLCEKHHQEKTSTEVSVDHGGGVSGKKSCKCDLCSAKRAEYMREWRRKKLGGVS
jgi:hypothetical protein